MQEFEKYVNIVKTDNDNFQLHYLDTVQSNQNVYNSIPTISIQVFSKNGTIQQTDKSKVKELLVEKIDDISKLNTDNFKLKNKDILHSVLKGSNIICMKSRIGKATNVLLSEHNYKKYNFKNISEKLELEVLIDDNIKDIILYRKNKISEPGMCLIYNDNYYDIIDVGFHPEDYFIRIEPDYRMEKLKRIVDSY